MKESSTYQAILDEGRAEEARKVLLLVGGKQFGPPDAQTRAAIDAITDLVRLEGLMERSFDVASWEELLKSS